MILVGLGSLLLIDRYFDIDWSFMSDWGGPAAFILLGIVLIVAHVSKRRRRKYPEHRHAAAEHLTGKRTAPLPPGEGVGVRGGPRGRPSHFYLRLKYFSRSSSDIERTTGRPWGQVKRSRVFAQSDTRWRISSGAR